MVSKETFLKTKQKYKNSKYTEFMLFTFLKDCNFNEYKITILSIFFIFNIIGAILNNMKNPLYLIFIIIANGIFVLFCLMLFVAVFINMYHTKKICDELNCNLEDLNIYENIYN